MKSSGSLKRSKPRVSPLLAPLSRRSSPRPRHGLPQKPTSTFPCETRRQWMLDALGTLNATTLSLAVQHDLIDSPQHHRAADVSMIESPSLETPESQAMHLLACYGTVNSPCSSIPSPKRPPVCAPACSLLPLYVRGNRRQSPTKPPHRLPSKPCGQLPLTLCLSSEMLAKLQRHLEDKLRGDIWRNEVRSRLARPLSATVFSNRAEQLAHDLSAPQLRSESKSPLAFYPYSIEAHDWSRRIGRMYRTHCARDAFLTSVRRLAIAIRYFRRVIKPWLVRAHRRRRRAAVRIQRQLRRFLLYKHHVVRPLAVCMVVQLSRLACARARARVVVTTKLRRLVQERRAMESHARSRRRVIFRWVAKTRVSLFVHKVWCVRWFHGKRARNLMRLRHETAELEASDAAVHIEYSTIFTTAFGRQLLKKELAAWRAGLKKPATPAVASDTEEAAGVGDSVVRLRQCFSIFDMDGSGALDIEEFELMLSHLRGTVAKAKSANSARDLKRAKLTTAQVRDLFESLDRDGDGVVACSEFEVWWQAQERSVETSVASGSASVTLLSTGLDRLVLTGHGMLFWLLGKKQQLERKFVKTRLVRKAQDSAKRVLLESWCRDEGVKSDETRRCAQCGRRFGLQRDLADHTKHQCRMGAGAWVVDAFEWRKWIREEELRLVEEEEEEEATALTPNHSDTKSAQDE